MKAALRWKLEDEHLPGQTDWTQQNRTMNWIELMVKHVMTMVTWTKRAMGASELA